MSTPQAQLQSSGSQDIDLDSAIEQLRAKFKVPRALVDRMVQQESGGNTRAVSPANARGRFQLIPETVDQISRETGKELKVDDPLDNAYAGLYYLRQNYDKFRKGAPSERGGWARAVAAYHAGPGNVQKDLDRGGLGIPDVADGLINTRDHVANIFEGTTPEDFLDNEQPSITSALDTLTKDVNERVKHIQPRDVFTPPSNVKLGTNDTEWHFGENIPSPSPRAMRVLQQAVVEDARKRAAGQTDFVRDPVYQAQMRRRAGLKPLSPISRADLERESYRNPTVAEIKQEEEQPIGFSRQGQPSRVTQTSDELRVMKGEQPVDRHTYARQQDAQTRISKMRELGNDFDPKKEEQWRAANQGAIDLETEEYRKDIRRAGGNADRWIAEFGSKAAAGLAELGAGLSGSDELRIKAEAAARAAQEEGADRNAVSKFVQDVGAGFISSAPELAAMTLSGGRISPVAAFGVGGALRAGGSGRDPNAGAVHGAGTGLAFEVPGVGQGVKQVLTKAGGVGAASTGVELATGASPRDAAVSGLTNAAMVAVPGLAGGRKGEKQTETQRQGVPTQQPATERVRGMDQEPALAQRATISPGQEATPLAVEQPQRFQHLQFGEIEVVADQSGARPGKIKVAEVADPAKQHFVRKADMQGRGNARMIPVRAGEPVAYVKDNLHKVFDEPGKMDNVKRVVAYDLTLKDKPPVRFSLVIGHDGTANVEVGPPRGKFLTENDEAVHKVPRVGLSPATVLAVKRFLAAELPEVTKIQFERGGSTGGRYGRVREISVPTPVQEKPLRPASESVLSQSLDAYGAETHQVARAILKTPKWKERVLAELGEGAQPLENTGGAPRWRTTSGDIVKISNAYGSEKEPTLGTRLSGIVIERQPPSRGQAAGYVEPLKTEVKAADQKLVDQSKELSTPPLLRRELDRPLSQEEGPGKTINLDEPIPSDALRAINRTFNQTVGPDIYDHLPEKPTAQDVVELLAENGLSDEILQQSTPKLRELGYSRIGDVLITEEGLKFAPKELPPAKMEQPSTPSVAEGAQIPNRGMIVRPETPAPTVDAGAAEGAVPGGSAAPSQTDLAQLAVPERPETLRLQMEQVNRAKRPAVLITEGEAIPEHRKGLIETPTEVGVWIHDPYKLKASEIKAKVADGSYHELLGIVEPKSEATDRVVTSRAPDGTEIESAAVSPANEAAQVKAYQERSPDAMVEAGTGESVIRERSFPKSAERAGLQGGVDRDYSVLTNKEAVERAHKRVEQDGIDRAISDLTKKERIDAEDTATGIVLMRQLQEAGDITRAADVASDLAKKLTEAGQAVQAASIVSRLSPEGVLIAAQRQMPEGKKLSGEQATELVAKATRAKEAEEKVAQLESELDRLRSKLESADSGAKPSTKRKAVERIGTLQDRLVKLEQDARARLAARSGVSKDGQAGASTIPLDLADFAIIGASKIAQKGMTFAKWSAEMAGEFGDDIKPRLREIYRASYRTYEEHRTQFAQESKERSARRADPTTENIQAVINERIDAQTQARKARVELGRIFQSLNKTPLQKFGRSAVDVLNLPRALMTTADLSAGFRQGKMGLARHPKIWFDAFLKQFKALNTKQYEKMVSEMELDPDFKYARRFGLELTSVGSSESVALGAREEAFQSGYAQRIPGVKHSEQAYNTMLDQLRMGWFKDYAGNLRKLGLDPERPQDVPTFQQGAELINAATGRGKLPRGLTSASPVLSTVFFSPRFWASRLKLISLPFDPRTYTQMSGPARVEAFKTLFGFTALVSSQLALAKISGAQVDVDPDSADFLKARWGKMHVDFSAGFQGHIRAGLALIKSLEQRQRGIKDARSPADILMRYARSKESPNASFAHDFFLSDKKIGTDRKLHGTDFAGQPVYLTGDPKGSALHRINTSAIADRFTPMVIGDSLKAYEEMGWKGAGATAITTGLGEGVSVYSPKTKPTPGMMTIRPATVGPTP